MKPDSKRGRPVEVDRHEVAQLALTLFEKRGFDEVTMDEIARSAKISRRTLFRAFPSKADLVWEGLGEVLGAVREHMTAREPVPLHRLVDELFLATLEQLNEPAMAKLARRRLKLIARSPGLLNHPTFAELQQVIITLVAASSTPDDPPPELVARALVGVGFASVLWWAEEGGSTSPADAMRGAMGALARAYRPRK